MRDLGAFRWSGDLQQVVQDRGDDGGFLGSVADQDQGDIGGNCKGRQRAVLLHSRQVVLGEVGECVIDTVAVALHQGIPSILCAWTDSPQRGFARQYSTAARVLRSTSGPSIGCSSR